MNAFFRAYSGSFGRTFVRETHLAEPKLASVGHSQRSFFVLVHISVRFMSFKSSLASASHGETLCGIALLRNNVIGVVSKMSSFLLRCSILLSAPQLYLGFVTLLGFRLFAPSPLLRGQRCGSATASTAVWGVRCLIAPQHQNLCVCLPKEVIVTLLHDEIRLQSTFGHRALQRTGVRVSSVTILCLCFILSGVRQRYTSRLGFSES